jgi:hypothetical protein
MSTKTTPAVRGAAHDGDAEIDRFLADNHDEIAAQLAAAREEILNGQATALEPLDELLRDARARR